MYHKINLSSKTKTALTKTRSYLAGVKDQRGRAVTGEGKNQYSYRYKIFAFGDATLTGTDPKTTAQK